MGTGIEPEASPSPAQHVITPTHLHCQEIDVDAALLELLDVAGGRRQVAVSLKVVPRVPLGHHVQSEVLDEPLVAEEVAHAVRVAVVDEDVQGIICNFGHVIYKIEVELTLTLVDVPLEEAGHIRVLL